MIFLFYGSDRNRVLGKVKSIEESFYKKAGILAQVFRFDGDNFNLSDFENVIRSENMFGGKRLVLARDLFLDNDLAGDILTIIEEPFAEGVTLVVYENKIDKDIVKKFDKTKVLIQEYKNAAVSDRRRKNHNAIFQVGDMLLAKNRLAAFSGYHELLWRGFTPENIFWNIYSQFKNMLLVASVSKLSPAQIQKETGLHPFVVQKGLGHLRNFSIEELENKFERLMFLWSDFVSEPKDLSQELELFILRP